MRRLRIHSTGPIRQSIRNRRRILHSAVSKNRTGSIDGFRLHIPQNIRPGTRIINNNKNKTDVKHIITKIQLPDKPP